MSSLLKRRSSIQDIKDKEEFNRQIALWATEDGLFDELVPIQLPICPQALSYYNNQKPEVQKRLESPFDKDEIKNYREERWKSCLHNKITLAWLYDLRRWLNDSDVVQRSKVNARINDFIIFYRKNQSYPTGLEPTYE